MGKNYLPDQLIAMSQSLLLSFIAPSRDAPVYIEQKSNKPGKTGQSSPTL